jgi:hypothetical protein
VKAAVPPDCRAEHHSAATAARAALRLAVLLACGMMLACTGARSPRADGEGGETIPGRDTEVAVEHDPGLRETSYTIGSGACRITWTVSATEANGGVIRQRADCGLPFAEQVSLISKVMRRVMGSDPEAAKVRTLFWGRLYPDGARDSTLAVRLALAAGRSAQWDAARGAPRNGDANGFVRQLANDALIYEELRQAFQQSGLEIRLVSVEKVLVLPAGRLPFFESLQEGGLRAEDRLPFDCMAWFSIR